MFIHPLVDGPAVFKIGSIAFSFYGLMYFLALVIYQTLGEYRLKKSQYFTENEFDVFSDYLLLSAYTGGCIGDILFYRLNSFFEAPWMFAANDPVKQNLWIVLAIPVVRYFLNKFSNEPLPALSFFILPILFVLTGSAGMSFHGALIGALVAVLIYSYKLNKNWLDTFDFIAPLVPPGLGVGRIGNFVNGELWGRPTEMPWGVVFPRMDFEVRHPSQLYECALEGILLFVILWNFSKTKRPRGAVFGLGLLLYAVFRIFVEFFREPSDTIGFIAWEWLTMGQLLSLPMLLGGIYLLFRAYFFAGKKPL